MRVRKRGNRNDLEIERERARARERERGRVNEFSLSRARERERKVDSESRSECVRVSTVGAAREEAAYIFPRIMLLMMRSSRCSSGLIFKALVQASAVSRGLLVVSGVSTRALPAWILAMLAFKARMAVHAPFGLRLEVLLGLLLGLLRVSCPIGLLVSQLPRVFEGALAVELQPAAGIILQFVRGATSLVVASCFAGTRLAPAWEGLVVALISWARW